MSSGQKSWVEAEEDKAYQAQIEKLRSITPQGLHARMEKIKRCLRHFSPDKLLTQAQHDAVREARHVLQEMGYS